MGKKVSSVQSSASLEAIAQLIEESAARLREVAASMREFGLETLEVANDYDRRQGVRSVENYAAAARLSLRERLEADGRLNGPEPSAPVKRGKKSGG